MAAIGTLAMLQAMSATAIAPPLMLTPTATLAAPTAAARALSLAALDAPPTAPVTITLQCLVSAAGRLGDCIPAADGGTRDAAAYRRRVIATAEQARADTMLAAALARMPFYRVAPPRPSGRATASLLVREVIAPADTAPSAAPTGTVAPGELAVAADPRVSPGDFYPPPALRSGAETRVAATCRVLDDLSLLCRDPRVDLPPLAGDPPMWRQPPFDPAFGQATLRALAAMHAASRTAAGESNVGREATLHLNWRLP